MRRRTSQLTLNRSTSATWQNGIALDDPEERLYDVMINLATKLIDKPEIASTLRSLVASVSD